MKFSKPKAQFKAKVQLCALFFAVLGCGVAQDEGPIDTAAQSRPVRIGVGAESMKEYLPLLEGKRVGVVTNQTGVVNGVHLVDSLLALGVDVQTVFCPEHGFRGTADAGAKIEDSRDTKTGLPLISLYGKNKKPKAEQLSDLDVILFDIQDVGARFYTYISTMHYCMEAAAENGKKMLVLDRPNPNGFYVDGPILDTAHRSFVGMHPIPIVHGLTVGELALMINGERWLNNELQCDLKVVSCSNYAHDSTYVLPIKPSPNLPNMSAILLYPSLCLFEGTQVSVGRGTSIPFQCIGHPKNELGNYRFTPVSGPGSKYPPFENQECHGFDLRQYGYSHFRESKQLNLTWLIDMYLHMQNSTDFFNPFFTKLAGTTELQKQIEEGWSAEQIRDSWRDDLDRYSNLRSRYLLYP